jgi:magnesium-transporting ATPase (P-type)
LGAQERVDRENVEFKREHTFRIGMLAQPVVGIFNKVKSFFRSKSENYALNMEARINSDLAKLDKDYAKDIADVRDKYTAIGNYISAEFGKTIVFDATEENIKTFVDKCKYDASSSEYLKVNLLMEEQEKKVTDKYEMEKAALNKVLAEKNTVSIEDEVTEVFDILTEIAHTSGDGSVEKKIQLLSDLLQKVDSVEDKNKLFMGSYIVAGKALALVSLIGMKTAFGAIANLISKEEKTLPLQDKINHLTRNLVFVAIVFAVATGIAFLVRSPAIDSSVMIEMAFLVLALSVSAFPEGFPVVLVTTLSAGAYRMARQNAIVNRMSVIETLGETTVICSDKTGTITRGEMTVKYVYADGRTFKVEGTGYNGEGYFVVDGKRCVPEKDNVLYFLNKAAVICNDASISRTGDDSNYSLIGTPTEGSLLIMAAKAGVFREDMQSTRLAELPFTSERKLMSVLAKLDASYIFGLSILQMLPYRTKMRIVIMQHRRMQQTIQYILRGQRTLYK